MHSFKDHRRADDGLRNTKRKENKCFIHSPPFHPQENQETVLLTDYMYKETKKQKEDQLKHFSCC